MEFSKTLKIAIIGADGRTGAMFAFELQKIADVLGVGRKIDEIKKKEFFIEKQGNIPEVFQGKVVSESQFPDGFLPEIVFLTIKNPVGPAVKYYYRKFKEKGFAFPVLVLSQNGIVAGSEALTSLKEVLGEKMEEVQVIRVSLFNPVDRKTVGNKIYTGYFPPVRLSFGVISGPKETIKIKEVFKKAGIEAEEVLPENVRNMEFSKLFTNLMGIPSAAYGLSVAEGFKNPEIFKEEISVLKEFVKTAGAAKLGFLNLKKFPIKFLAFFIYYFPLPVLIFFRNRLAKLTDKGRKGKPKGNLDEIDYYNGEVVKMGKKLGIPVPVNEKLLEKVRKILNS